MFAYEDDEDQQEDGESEVNYYTYQQDKSLAFP